MFSEAGRGRGTMMWPWPLPPPPSLCRRHCPLIIAVAIAALSFFPPRPLTTYAVVRGDQCVYRWWNRTPLALSATRGGAHSATGIRANNDATTTTTMMAAATMTTCPPASPLPSLAPRLSPPPLVLWLTPPPPAQWLTPPATAEAKVCHERAYLAQPWLRVISEWH